MEYCIGVILRSTTLNTLITFNLYKILLETEGNKDKNFDKEKVIKHFCDIMLSDGLEHTLKYVKGANDVNMISKNQLESIYKNLTTNYRHFFQDYNNDGAMPALKLESPPSPTKLFKMIALTPELKEFSKIYDLYLFFSKYDHYRIFYFELSKLPFEEKIQRINTAIELLIGPHSMLHVTLRIYSNNDSFLNQQPDIAAKYLYQNIISTLDN